MFKKKVFIILFFIIPISLFCNSLLFWTYRQEFNIKKMLFLNAKDLKLNRNIKEYIEEYDSFNYYYNWTMKYDLKFFPVNLKAKWKDIYNFDKNGNILKIESFSDDVSLIERNYVYRNNRLEEIVINSKDRYTPASDNYKFIYDENNKTIEIQETINNLLYYIFYIEYEQNKLVIKVFNHSGKGGFKEPRLETYYIFKYENSQLVELSNYSSNDKLLFIENYYYDDENNINFIEVNDLKKFDKKSFFFDYIYDNNKNNIEENLYEKINDKVKKLNKKIFKIYKYY